MENHQNLLIVIAPWSDHSHRERSTLRRLVKDLRNEEFSILHLPPLGPPWFPRELSRLLHEHDIDDWEYILHRLWRHYPDWRESYPEWREEFPQMLREVAVRGKPRVVVLLAPFLEEKILDSDLIQDFVRVVEPAAIIDLGIGEVDPLMAERMPGVKTFNYLEDRDGFLRFLRSFGGERLFPIKALPDRFEMARSEFIERTSDQERPKITVAYPEAMAPSNWSTLEVFIYLKSFKYLVQKEIFRLQQREDLEYSGVTSEFPKSLPIGCPIKISLQSNSLHTNPSEIAINWYEPYYRLPFRISPVDETKDEYSATLDIEVFADDLPVASMRLTIAVNSDTHQKSGLAVASDDASWYENIFASYAREDIYLVKCFKKRYEALGLNMFIDLDDLRSGVQWRPALIDGIDKSDLFQLFWSDYSKKSKYVTVEWKRALTARSVKGNRFIRPVYWHDPIPPVPNELAEINFRRISFVEP